MLSEESQAQKANILYDFITGHHPWKGKTIGTEIKSVLVIEEGNWLQRGIKELLENALYYDYGGGYMTVYVCQNSSNYTLKNDEFSVSKLYLNKSGFKFKRDIYSWLIMNAAHKGATL